MIIVIHNISKVVQVYQVSKNRNIDFDNNKSIGRIVHELSKEFPEELILWSNELVVDYINYDSLESIFHHDRILTSYSTSEVYAIPSSIGYVEQSPFLKVKKDVIYPTWLMSSTIGGAKGKLLANFGYLLNLNELFPTVLNHLSKIAQKKGVFCYSNPDLLKSYIVIEEPQCNFFPFVRRHYKTRWMFLLLFNLFIYEKKFPFYDFILAFFKTKKSFFRFNIDLNLDIQSSLKSSEFTVDVVIPTVGREEYLFNVLSDFSKQSVLPEKVIIIEQTKDGVSKLDYLDENWPFKIKHLCISKFGACNARNLGLKEVTSNWVFLADDDNRMKSNLLEELRDTLKNYGLECLTTSYLQEGEIEKIDTPIQWITFGAGNSIINSKLLNKISFNTTYEFGYGEDADFGMQLRNLGIDVIYFPNIRIKHLKAPIGGFRFKYEYPWINSPIQPKPSPTVMAYHLLHDTSKQLLGYKTILFLKYYRDQNTKNPFKFLKIMKQSWNNSQYWAHKLIDSEV